MQEEAGSLLVRVGVEVVDSAGVEGAGAPDEVVDLVALAEQEPGHVRPVLADDPCDECLLGQDFPDPCADALSG